MSNEIDDLDLDLNSEGATATTEKSQKSKLGLIIVASAVIVIGGGAGAFFLMNGDEKTPAVAQITAEQTKPSKPQAKYLKLEPIFEVNIQDKFGRKHYLHIDVSIMTRDEQVAEAIKNNKPLLVNDLLSLFGTQSYENLLTVEGKSNLRKQALASVKKIMQQQAGKDDVESILFTKFVME